ncbi:MAG: hypothetical protein QXH67_00080 [Candidatus Bathyarchaeia archaeon]
MNRRGGLLNHQAAAPAHEAPGAVRPDGQPVALRAWVLPTVPDQDAFKLVSIPVDAINSHPQLLGQPLSWRLRIPPEEPEEPGQVWVDYRGLAGGLSRQRLPPLTYIFRRPVRLPTSPADVLNSRKTRMSRATLLKAPESFQTSRTRKRIVESWRARAGTCRPKCSKSRSRSWVEASPTSRRP